MLKNQELPIILKVAENRKSCRKVAEHSEAKPNNGTEREDRRALVGICEFHQLYFLNVIFQRQFNYSWDVRKF